MRSIHIRICAAAVLIGIAAGSTSAQRERTRPAPRRQTAVSESQANELTLTLTDVSVRPIQVWVRTAGVMDDARKTVAAEVSAEEGRRIKVGQRVRAFSPQSRSRMHQANVTTVTSHGDTVTVRATLTGQPLDANRYLVLEIVTEDGESLSVPNEAIIEVGGKQVVYVQEGGGYAPRDVRLGVQGELFTQVLDGLSTGEKVVTIGSFFIDAEHKLKGS